MPLTQFSRDLARGDLPSFALVVPNLCHDTHDCSVATGDRWLRSFLAPLLHSPALAQSAIFVVGDEPPGLRVPGAPVPALALGPLVRPGSTYARSTSDYGLLRTLEDSWGLPRLGRSSEPPRSAESGANR